MKKLGVKGIIGLTFEFIAVVFLVLCICTNIADDVFLPIALGCTCVGSGFSFAMQIENKKKNK